jgi:hypothetical protein
MKRRGFLKRLFGAAAAVPAAVVAPKVAEAVENAFPAVVEEPVEVEPEWGWTPVDEIGYASACIPVCTTVSYSSFHRGYIVKK